MRNWQITWCNPRQIRQVAAELWTPRALRDPNGPLALRGLASAPWVLQSLSGSWLPGSLFGVAAWILEYANSELGGNDAGTQDYGGCFQGHTRGTWPFV